MGRPARLSLRALAVWRPMPSALWLSGADDRLNRMLARAQRQAAWRLFLLAAILLGLVGPLSVYRWEITASNGPGREQPRLTETVDFLYGRSSVYGHLDSGEPPSCTLRFLFRRGFFHERPGRNVRWTYTYGFPPKQGSFSTFRRFVSPTSVLVFLPVGVWIAALAVLTSFTKARQGHTPLHLRHRWRRAALLSMSAACWVPIRAAWALALLLVIPLFAWPQQTVMLRANAFFLLVVLATAAPTVIATRVILADRPGICVAHKSVAVLLLLGFVSACALVLVRQFTRL